MTHISKLHDCNLLLHDPELYREITSYLLYCIHESMEDQDVGDSNPLAPTKKKGLAVRFQRVVYTFFVSPGRLWGGLGGATPKKGDDSFSRYETRSNSPSVLTTHNSDSQPIIFKVSKSIGSALNEFHFSMESFNNSIASGVAKHPGNGIDPTGKK